MKLDSEPMCGHSTMVHNPVSKSLDSAVEIEGLKSGNETMREDKHRITSDLKSQNCEMDIDPLSTEKHKKDTIGNILGLDDFMDMDDLKNGRENENGDSVAPCTSPSSEIELSEKETDFYTDKSVMECEMPELIDCFKEIAYHVVKDICIDEGVPSLDKILVENGKQDSKHSFQPSDLDLSSDVTKEMVDSLAPISDEVKSLVEHDYDEDASQCSFKTLLPKGEGKFDANDAIAHGVSDEKVVPENLVALQKLDMENSCLVSSIFEGDEGQQQSELVHQCGSENLLRKGEENIDAKGEITHDVSDEIVAPENMVLLQKLDMENSRTVSSSFSGDEGQQLSDQDTSKEAISANSAVSYMTEESSNSIHVSKVPSDREVESGSITFDFDSPTPAINGREESPPNVDCQQSLQSLHTSGIEDGTVDSRTASSRSLYIQHGHGESSFSAVGPLSGPIAYSGPIPYSGSISLRSDSSTTSTRSFAFPILHSEWNSSPVKMAKADRRHYRKHRGWRLSLLCCRF